MHIHLVDAANADAKRNATQTGKLMTKQMFLVRRVYAHFEIVTLNLFGGIGYRAVGQKYATSLEAARKHVPEGFAKIDRDESDPHDIVETWKEEL